MSFHFPTKLALLAATAASGFVLPSLPAHADETDQRIKSIEQQIRALQGELHHVRHDLAVRDTQVKDAQQQAAAARAAAAQAQARAAYPQTTANPLLPAPTAAPAGAPPAASMGYVSFPNGRPTLTSADGKYAFSIGLQMHYDFGGFITGSHHPAGAPVGGGDRLTGFSQNLRRLRIPFMFKAGDFVINVTPDFGGSMDGTTGLYEANFNYVGIKPLTLTVGYFKPWITLADAPSSSDFVFPERASIMEIARNVAAGDARASAGFRAYGKRWFVASYLTTEPWGYQNKNGTKTNYEQQQMGGTFRIAGRPLAMKDADIHIGFSGSDVWQAHHQLGNSGGTLQLSDYPEARLDNNKMLDTGQIQNVSDIYTVGPEFGARYKSFLLTGEWVQIGVNRDKNGASPSSKLTFNGGYVEASWVITGEPRLYDPSSAGFTRPKPRHSVLDGGSGAFEVGARYSVADLNDKDIHGGRQEVETVGLNWYPTNNLRTMLDYDIINVDKHDAKTNAQIGQRVQAVTVRLQAQF
jgi:phosphate-selective porin OprO and OprP